MSSKYLEINLKCIASFDETLTETLRNAYRSDYPEIRTSKTNLPVPVVNRKCLHSTYDPVSEAGKWIETLELNQTEDVCYVIGGIGFGYHVKELAKRVPPHRLIVVEKDAGLAAAALASSEWDLLSEGLRLMVGEEPVQAYEHLMRWNCKNQLKPVFFEHPASSSAYPDYYTTIGGMIRAQETVSRGGYKILLVSPLYGGSLPVTGYVHRALNSLGHRCELLDNTLFYPALSHFHDLTSNQDHEGRLKAGLTAVLAESVTARALEIRADLVLCMAQSPVTPEVLQELKKSGIQTAFWFVEDYQTLNYWQAVAQHIENFFVIQKGEFFEQLKKIGCAGPYYLPLAADPEVHCPLQLSPADMEEFGSDLSHVGAGYHNRRNFFAGLLDLNFKIWGNEWDAAAALNSVIQRDGERVTTEDSVKVFNATSINVNLHSSTYHDGVNPFGDFVNPRTFEIASCRAFQLVDERRYLNDCFAEGSEMITFSSLQDFREKAAHYLANPHQRIEIAEAARQRVLAQHTYEHRMLELLGLIAGRNPAWIPRGGGLPTAEEIIKQEKPGSELAQVMQRFEGCGPMTLEEISTEIEKGEGALTNTEAMILLLNEFRRWGLEKGVL
jgi:spore maturation protein CgeB